MLGLEATHTHLKGALFGPGQTAVRRESGWLLQSPLSKRSDMIEHLRWLLDALEPKREVIQEVSRKYRIDFFCGFASLNGQGGSRLTAALSPRVADLGVPLALDLDPPGIEEISDDKPLAIQ